MNPYVFIEYYLVFFAIFISFLFIIFETKKPIYFWYFIFGSILGFISDTLSFNFGYLYYPSFFLIKILGLPFSMTLAEGFASSITIYLFDTYVKKIFNLRT